MARKKATRKKPSKSKQNLKKKILIGVLKLFVAGLIALTVFFALVWIGAFGRLPNTNEITKIKNQTATVVYSADKVMIGKFYYENRLTIDNKNISKHVKNALVATEDSRFFEHKGLDFISLGRVALKTIVLGNRHQGGGSTISQQLAKNLYPRKHYGIFTIPVNKVREIFIAARLEKVFSKEEVLGLYLNTVPFGENIYGIEVAANRFFGKSSSKLTPPEAATLVGMLAANTAYNPKRNPEMSKKRRNIVLDRMLAQGFLTREETLQYKESPIRLSYSRLDNNQGPAAYFMEQIRMEAEKILEDEYGSDYNLYADGLRIYTTLDASLQKYAVKALKEHMQYLQKTFEAHWGKQEPWHNQPEVYYNALRKTSRYLELKNSGLQDKQILEALKKPVNTTLFSYNGDQKVSISPADSVKKALRLLQAGIMAMNPADGHVLVWEGGIGYQHFKYDHVTAQRQVGSTFKPIVFATALNQGYSPCEYISNERRIYRRFNDWSPANSNGDHHGYYTLKGGLVHSVNTISAEVINKTGVSDVIDMARNMGVTASIPQVPSIALGTADISLKEMVTAYSAFANYGFAVKPVLLLKIEDANGKVLYEKEPDGPMSPAFNEETARMMVQILREVVENGTARGLKTRYGLKGDYAGKTGTTQNNADGWFIGFTPNLVAGVWVGADNPAVHFRSTSLGQGAHMALPIFAKFMQQAENSPNHRHLRTQMFYPLPEELMSMMDCPDFAEEDPTERSFFQRLFNPEKVETPELEKKETPTEESSDKDKNLLDRMKELFRKKR